MNPPLLFVDDRPCTLAEVLLQRTDVRPVLLRFKQVLGELPPAWLKRTEHLPSFVVDLERPLEEEAARFRRWQAEQGLDVRHFCNPSEPRQHVSQRFARLLGLPCLSEEQVHWLRNKVAMKEKLAAIGFDVAACAPVSTREDILAFARQHGWPLVLKPQEGFACIETYKLSTPADVERLALGPAHRWMVETFIPDEEYECCALISGGKVLDTYLAYFPAPPLAATDGEMNANITYRHVPPELGVDMREVVQRIVTGMGLDHGYMHLELFIGPGGSYRMSEVGLRLAGCEIPANHGLAFGFDIFGTLIDIHLGRRPQIQYTQERCVGDLLLPIRPGLITELSPLEELLSLEGVLKGRLKVSRGDVISARRASHVSAGFVHVEGATVEEVERRMQRVLEHYRIVTVPPPVEGAAA